MPKKKKVNIWGENIKKNSTAMVCVCACRHYVCTDSGFFFHLKIPYQNTRMNCFLFYKRPCFNLSKSNKQLIRVFLIMNIKMKKKPLSGSNTHANTQIHTGKLQFVEFNFGCWERWVAIKNQCFNANLKLKCFRIHMGVIWENMKMLSVSKYHYSKLNAKK